MKIFVAASLVFACSLFAQTPSPSVSGNTKHPFTFEDMMALKRVGAPVPSPDGKCVVFDCEDFDWCRRRDLVAGREEHRIRVGSASGLRGRCVQQAAR